MTALGQWAYRLSSALLLASSTQPALAALNLNQYQKVVAITLASEWFNPVAGQRVNLLPEIGNYYTKAGSNAVFNGGAFIGVDGWLNQKLESRLGVGIYSNTPATMKGNVWLFEDPDINFLGYRYRTSSTRYLVEGKLLLKYAEHILPYFGYGLGAATNHLSRYQQSVPEAMSTFIPSAPFQTNNTTSFTYDLAAGLEYVVHEHGRVSIAYQYNSMGKAAFKPSLTQATNQALSIANLQSNQLRFQLSYIT